MKAKNSPEERFEGSEATYDRDEISGPLRGAGRGVSSIETDGYEEEMEKVDGEWHRSTVKKHTEVVMDPKEAVRRRLFLPRQVLTKFSSGERRGLKRVIMIRACHYMRLR